MPIPPLKVRSVASPPASSALAELRHDLRNTLTPALMCADLLSQHEDSDVQEQARAILMALERTLKRLEATKHLKS